MQEDSRGIVHPAAAHTVFSLDRFPPTDGPARFVDRYWISTWRLPPGVRHEQQVLAHPVVNMVFEADGAIVKGVDTGRFSITLEGRGRGLGVMFRPAAFAPFFDGPLTKLTDTELPLARVPALAGLEALLVPLVADLDVPAEQLAATADAALAERVPAERQDCETTTEWAELAVRDRELTRVEDLARAAGVGVRTLQRAFTEHVGIGPKWFLRRYRLYEAGERIAHRERIDWAELATDLGYADQAHLTRDFTAAFGVPPAQYAAAARDRGDHDHTDHRSQPEHAAESRS
ncbi:AraC family transcriptional regulator [Catenulispora sp. NL8]|uniref:AraC family transcriptional regulator n=1 Tax=Catenulispora pinistramenti TaxID=2705254 RepID=A0ABS5L8D4_9ACTN|nr:AraC family transcriptional regulator [Catenulispora pinistramenti]